MSTKMPLLTSVAVVGIVALMALSGLVASANAGGGAQVSAAREPVDVVLAVDCTGSMNDIGGANGTKYNYTKQSIVNFTDSLDYDYGDRCALVAFSSTLVPPISVVLNYTNDTGIISGGISALPLPSGGTNFYDAVGFCVNYANKNHYPVNHSHPHDVIPGHHQPVVVVLTDGIDSGSLTHDLISIIEYVTNSYNSPPPAFYKGYETRVYCIGLGPSNQLDASGMTSIANNGGGQYLHAESGAELNATFASLAAILTSDTVVPEISSAGAIAMVAPLSLVGLAFASKRKRKIANV